MPFLTFACTADCDHQVRLIYSSLTQDERADLDYFFRELIFENYGAFVLFGSKPLCEMSLIDVPVLESFQQRYLATISDDEKSRWDAEKKQLKAQGLYFEHEHERNPFRGFQVWKTIHDKIGTKRYIVAVHPVGEGLYSLVLADVVKVALVLAENYDIFKKITGEDFHPFEMVYELNNSNSPFWNKILSEGGNFVGKGLLYGYGKKNSLVFGWEKEDFFEMKTFLRPSTAQSIPYGCANPDNFAIPFFQTIEEDNIAAKYEKEKVYIQKKYRNKNLVEVTLQRVFN